MKKPKPTPNSFEAMRESVHRQMLSSVSHDLKTPLATMIGSLEIYQRMEAKLTPEKKAALIGSALGEAYRLDSFITNILDMAKLESGTVNIKRDQIELLTLLQDCLARLGPRAQKGNITLKRLGRGSAAQTDPMLLGRAVGLVLDNALKHGGEKVAVVIEYGCEDNQITVNVCDNGPGISSGKEEEIFSKYTRLSRNDQQNAGTGLGLAIARQVMTLLHGSVAVSNRAEGGAAFMLRCPSSL